MPQPSPPLPPRATAEYFFFGDPLMTSLGLRAIGAGRCQRDYRLARPIEQRRLKFHCIILISNGHAWFDSPHVGHRLCQTGDAFLLHANDFHGYGVLPDEPFEETWIAFDGEAIRLAEAEGQIIPNQPFYPGIGHRITHLMEAAFHLAATPSATRLSLPALMHEILIALDRRPGSSESAIDPALASIRATIAAALHDPVDLHALATRHGMSYSSMRSKFRATFGTAPGQYHLIQKLNHACRLLSNGTGVAECAYAIGMQDPYYFSRLFRRHIGMPPTAFVRRERERPS